MSSRNEKLPLSIIIIYSSSGENRYLDQSCASVSFASEVLQIDVGAEKIENFSKVRNKALEVVSNDWVLFLDSDEELEAGSKKEIEEIVLANDCDLVSVIRNDVFLGKMLSWGETRNVKILRMGKKNKIKFTRPVHEVMESGVYKVCHSQIKIKHFAHTSISSFFAKVYYYAGLEVRGRLKGKPNSFVVFLQMIFFPPLKFIFNFIFKLGFLDGTRGLVYALMMSFHSFFVRIFILEGLQKKNENI